jgi:hypothetical protein
MDSMLEVKEACTRTYTYNKYISNGETVGNI